MTPTQPTPEERQVPEVYRTYATEQEAKEAAENLWHYKGKKALVHRARELHWLGIECRTANPWAVIV